MAKNTNSSVRFQFSGGVSWEALQKRAAKVIAEKILEEKKRRLDRSNER